MIPSEGRYEIRFIPEAFREWNKLDNSIRQPLSKRLSVRLLNPVVENDRLSGQLKDCFKIKDNKSGFRVVYFLSQSEQMITVLAVGKRADKEVYKDALLRV